MPQRKLVSQPDQNSGPALLGREPILFPQQRKKAADRVKSAINNS